MLQGTVYGTEGGGVSADCGHAERHNRANKVPPLQLLQLWKMAPGRRLKLLVSCAMLPS